MIQQFDIQNKKLVEILEKTKEMFFELGIRNLNMDDISRKLGMSKKTLYQFVKSKEDLVRKLFLLEESRWDCCTQSTSMAGLNAIDILFKASLMVYEEMKRFNPMLKFELRKYYEPLFNEYLIKKRDHIFNHIKNNLVQGINEGLYRNDNNLELVASLYVSTLVDMHNRDYCEIQNITFSQVFQVMFENHVRGISTPEGIAYFEKKKREANINDLVITYKD